MNIRVTDIPKGSLLSVYQSPTNTTEGGNYCDCFCSTIDGNFALAEFVYAFYTTRPFRLERRLLAMTMKLPASNEQAMALASAKTDTYSFWTMEKRRSTELLMKANNGQTGSWLMVRPGINGSIQTTELFFGSVVFFKDGKTMPFFKTLTIFHTLYSRVLLASAARRVKNLRVKERRSSVTR